MYFNKRNLEFICLYDDDKSQKIDQNHFFVIYFIQLRNIYFSI